MNYNSEKDNGWSKKTPLYFNIGLIVSLAIVLTAFEWSSPAGVPEVFTAQNTGLFEETPEVFVIPTTPPPPIKVIVNPQIEIVKDDAKIEEENAKIITDFAEGDKIDVPADVPIKEQVQELEIETPETIFTVVESAAEPEGGFQAFYKYIGETMKYPKQARRMGIEGKVFVQFIVETDGTIQDVKVLKGIGAGCDEEALGVVSTAGKWKPAKNRGHKVRQRMIVPISFKLSK